MVSGREAYRGPYLNQAPDLIIEPSDDYSIARGVGNALFSNIIFNDKIGSIGEHDENGIFIACGPSFANDSEFDTYSILSVTPTALYLLGLPIPSLMDGQPLYEICKGDKPRVLDAPMQDQSSRKLSDLISRLKSEKRI